MTQNDLMIIRSLWKALVQKIIVDSARSR